MRTSRSKISWNPNIEKRGDRWWIITDSLQRARGMSVDHVWVPSLSSYGSDQEGYKPILAHPKSQDHSNEWNECAIEPHAGWAGDSFLDLTASRNGYPEPALLDVKIVERRQTESRQDIEYLVGPCTGDSQKWMELNKRRTFACASSEGCTTHLCDPTLFRFLNPLMLLV